MSSNDNNTAELPITLETATKWARSNCQWEKVYRYLFLHPTDFFAISPGRRWSIAHQVVYHGDVDLLKRILAFFSEDQIDIHTKSGDDKTLLNVALERQHEHPTMYTYVEHLFAQDELIQAAKQSDWRLVSEMLEKDRHLANEKPPYSPYFLLHYVVQNGDAKILTQLLDRFQFLTNVLNSQKETPLDMALRLNKYDMCSILQPRTISRPQFSYTQPQSPQYSSPTNDRSTDYSPFRLPSEPAQYQSPSSMPNPPPNPYSPTTKTPPTGFGNIVLNISENGDFRVGSSVLQNSARKQPPPPSPARQPSQPSTSGFQHVYTKKSIISECPLVNEDPLPSSPPPIKTASAASNEQVMKNLTCPLTRKIFVDPVIASDGQTYERKAIEEWIEIYHCSPTTGASMEATFRDNIEIKQIILSMQRQS